ncbi:MAG: fasciclin domain-containing protein, partial [Maribacter sp.]|nr:fasciclin domain-containing protein [Maribacter sp.]
MKNLGKILKSTAMVMLLVFATSCSDDDNDDPVIIVEEDNIVEAAQKTSSLSSLVSALAKADESANNDLITALSSEGPFTVLAPTNDAFASLLARLDGFDSLEDFNNEQLQDLLATILKYHVVSGAAVGSGDLTEGQTITTLQGETLTVSIANGVTFTDAAAEMATVTTADVETQNGIVHIIDKVLIPQEALDALSSVLLTSITDLAISVPSLSILVEALIAADGD